MDALLTKARQVPDPAERKKLYDQATEIMMRDIPRLQLWHRRVFTGLHRQAHRASRPTPTASFASRGLKLN